MKLIDRFISRELIVNVLFAIAVLSLLLVAGNISVAGKNFPGRALLVIKVLVIGDVVIRNSTCDHRQFQGVMEIFARD